VSRTRPSPGHQSCSKGSRRRSRRVGAVWDQSTSLRVSTEGKSPPALSLYDSRSADRLTVLRVLRVTLRTAARRLNYIMARHVVVGIVPIRSGTGAQRRRSRFVGLGRGSLRNTRDHSVPDEHGLVGALCPTVRSHAASSSSVRSRSPEPDGLVAARDSMCLATRFASRPAPRTSIELKECRKSIPRK